MRDSACLRRVAAHNVMTRGMACLSPERRVCSDMGQRADAVHGRKSVEIRHRNVPVPQVDAPVATHPTAAPPLRPMGRCLQCIGGRLVNRLQASVRSGKVSSHICSACAGMGRAMP
jgi:hypothetical protein